MPDLTAAFDKIERKWIFQSIRQRIPGSQEIVDILQKLYTHTTSALAETPKDKEARRPGVANALQSIYGFCDASLHRKVYV